jgi:hypothetical protein
MLPLPIILSQSETLHAIHLPPLAQFLTALTAPDHLLKLNDILDRYRTPSSYHRIDVRVTSSSELPPGSPVEWETAWQTPWGREKGEPVVLPEGVDVEGWKEQHGLQGNSLHAKVDIFPQTDGAGPSTLPEPNPIRPSLTIYPLPPSAPERRVRELRLDIRSLDAAALFALETWRRQVLGLAKLEMEHPDSIWYKAVEEEVPQNAKRPRGRPRKTLPVVDWEAGDVLDGPVEVLDGPVEDEVIFAALNEVARSLLHNEVRDRTPSPDILLDDGFDNDDEKDPSFVPAKAEPRRPADHAIEAKAQRSVQKRPRKSADQGPSRALCFQPPVVPADFDKRKRSTLARPIRSSEAVDAGSASLRYRLDSVEIPGRKRPRREKVAKRVSQEEDAVNGDDAGDVEEVAACSEQMEEELASRGEGDLAQNDDDEWGFLKQI